jgi:hypothetical protein
MTVQHYTRTRGERVLIAEMQTWHLEAAIKRLEKIGDPARGDELSAMRQEMDRRKPLEPR